MLILKQSKIFISHHKIFQFCNIYDRDFKYIGFNV